MGYHDQDDLPYLYWLSKNFAISDRNFCSLLGPTWPNRFYFYGGTSWGNTQTGDLGDLLPNSVPSKGKKITEQLDEYVRQQEKAFEEREREGLDELLKRRRELETNVEMHEKTVFFQTSGLLMSLLTTRAMNFCPFCRFAGG